MGYTIYGQVNTLEEFEELKKADLGREQREQWIKSNPPKIFNSSANCRDTTNIKTIIKIVHRRNGLYDIYDKNTGEWLFTRNSADNIFIELSKRHYIKIEFEEE